MFGKLPSIGKIDQWPKDTIITHSEKAIGEVLFKIIKLCDK